VATALTRDGFSFIVCRIDDYTKLPTTSVSRQLLPNLKSSSQCERCILLHLIGYSLTVTGGMTVSGSQS